MAIRITVTPDPPIAGQLAQFCYDFDNSGITETTINIRWVPTSLPDNELSLSKDEPCAYLQIPGSATSGQAIDASGVSGMFGFSVS